MEEVRKIRDEIRTRVLRLLELECAGVKDLISR
jgi:hypothetical protein